MNPAFHTDHYQESKEAQIERKIGFCFSAIKNKILKFFRFPQ